ncbi:hypothetical protein SAY87_023318 [Trapa incisa]|uniref:Terpene synthase metal-binding domain-containing protein n=1 Tax=Trapa incisa TaxID=236973 RepID=A0AAN7Q644_9MYRT|nr:hypothetical protein SAY87_023318 [Trapa incisa]
MVFYPQDHPKEIHDISRWWKEKDIMRRLTFARDRVVEVLDDIYDAYQLKLLTDAIERWDIRIMDQLPQYMQVFYKGLLDL